MTDHNDNILEVSGLKTYFFLAPGVLKAVDGVDFTLEAGKALAIIGESGSGKSVAVRSIMRIVTPPGQIVAGSIMLKKPNCEPVDIVKLAAKGRQIRSIRGGDIAMIFQEPMTSLSPVHTIGEQIIESVLLHRTKDKHQAKQIAIDMLEKVGIANPAQRYNEYPHQMSGGMRQRAMIAMALASDPIILIADEPTTALDVTVQAQILELIGKLQKQLGMAVIYITHDLGVVAEIAEEVVVMYLGRVVERTAVKSIFNVPLHPYTQALLRSIPKLGSKTDKPLETIEGNVPVPMEMPPQCGFFSRCTKAIHGRCDKAVPALVELSDNHFVRCFLYSEKEETV